jgi:hypothetical protein
VKNVGQHRMKSQARCPPRVKVRFPPLRGLHCGHADWVLTLGKTAILKMIRARWHNRLLGAISPWIVENGVVSKVVLVLCRKGIKVRLKPSGSIRLLRHVLPSAVSMRHPRLSSPMLRCLSTIETACFARHEMVLPTPRYRGTISRIAASAKLNRCSNIFHSCVAGQPQTPGAASASP